MPYGPHTPEDRAAILRDVELAMPEMILRLCKQTTDIENRIKAILPCSFDCPRIVVGGCLF